MIQLQFYFANDCMETKAFFQVTRSMMKGHLRRNAARGESALPTQMVTKERMERLLLPKMRKIKCVCDKIDDESSSVIIKGGPFNYKANLVMFGSHYVEKYFTDTYRCRIVKTRFKYSRNTRICRWFVVAQLQIKDKKKWLPARTVVS